MTGHSHSGHIGHTGYTGATGHSGHTGCGSDEILTKLCWMEAEIIIDCSEGNMF